LKIIHCLNHYLPQQVAGTEVYAQALINESFDKGIDAVVLIPNYNSFVTEQYKYENTKVIKYAEPSIVNRDLITRKTIPEGLSNFIKVIIEEKPDIVHFHIVGGSNGITLHHVRIVNQYGIRIVLTLHIAGYTCKTGNLLYKNAIPCNGLIDSNKCTRCLYNSEKITGLQNGLLSAAANALHRIRYNTNRWNNTLGTALGYPFLIDELKNNLLELATLCDKMVVLAQWYKNVLELNGVPANKLHIISQGVPRQYLQPGKKINTDTLKLVFVGRINPSKGLMLLIKAIKEIPAHQVSLSVFGQADEPGYYEVCRAASDNMVNISWEGVLSPGLVVSTLSRFDCLCLPSVICEMSPLVIQEAFAACIPVIASDVYGNAEQIKNGSNGWLFEFNDTNDLKNKILNVIKEPFLLAEARSKIRPVKTFASVADEYEIIYDQVIDCK
jgi:glycosyltransferase involved in cell wall biosynthesis